MNESGHFHTISRTAAGNLAIYRVELGRTFVDVVRTDVRFFRALRLRRRLAAAFAKNSVWLILIEGDVRFDFELRDAIAAAGKTAGTKVIQ